MRDRCSGGRGSRSDRTGRHPSFEVTKGPALMSVWPSLRFRLPGAGGARGAVGAAGAGAGAQARSRRRHAARRLRGRPAASRRGAGRGRAHREGRADGVDADSARLHGDRHQRPHDDAGDDRAARSSHPARARQLRPVVPVDRQAGPDDADHGDGDRRQAAAERRRDLGRRPGRAAGAEPERARPHQQGRDPRPAHVDERPVDHPLGAAA